ncbi:MULTISPECIES: GNAT family N-acetyltransferase [unclassified Streptomyces]|uniref:GNAT family N-acetyltransferase n=1 Tax=unclassified Streptomyces TaxID=2593676 RepID=UPI00166050EF|nr:MULTISPECIES: GNAT family N-acetyltransferase [unclassified Streptomyces]MBD0707775.1 GNAT family N-acetyltransferase [Streptomyces sp. CBMA291]MBD0713044.1 GNAT family N-acetyltransferase [Streptomyces sp. CBMA370]
MTVIVRDVKAEDAGDFARVRRTAVPCLLASAEQCVFDWAHAHPESHRRPLVAVTGDGEVIGTAETGIAHEAPEPGLGFVNIYVDPAHQGRGAGTLLLRAAEEHLAARGARSLFSWVLDAPENTAWAARRGYSPSRSAYFLRLDLASAVLPPLQEPPAGVELLTAEDFAEDPRPLFTLDAVTTADEPSDVGAELADYAHWRETTWEHPLFDRALTTVAVVDGVPVAFSAAQTDGTGRYGTGMTGTAPAFRGRGLAKLVKNASLHRARAAGCTEALTGNDTENGPMLAINKWFGYEVAAREVRHVRTFG